MSGAERDPRVGELYVNRDESRHIFRIDRDGDVWFEMEDGSVSLDDAEGWRKWAATAEVVHWAEVSE